MIRLLTYLLFSALFPISLWAQHPYYYNISTADGLPSNEVYELLQDSFGYIWIGCDAGLFRYDGFEFKPYLSSNSKARSMSYLKMDKNGDIWCQNFVGQIFKVEGDSLSLRVAHEEKCGFGMHYAFSPDGRLWVGCGEYLDVYDLDGQSLKEQCFSTQKFFDKRSWINALTWHKGHLYMFLGKDGIYRYQESTLSLEKMRSGKHLYGGPMRLSSLNGQLWVGFINNQKGSDERGGYLLQLFEDSLYVQHKIEQNFSINKLGVGKASENFFVGDFGVFYTEAIAPPDSFSIKEHFFPNVRISDILLDREGNYWFSSLDYGIYVLPSIEIRQFEAVQTKGAKQLFLDPQHRLWVGGNKGELYYLDKKNTKHQVLENGEYFSGAIKNIRIGRPNVLYISGYGNIQIDLNTMELLCSRSGSSRDVLVYGDYTFTASSAGFFKKQQPNSLGKITTVYKKQVSTWGVEVDSVDQSIWATLSTGIEYYKNGKLEPVLDKGERIYGKALDYHQGLMWVGTVNQGIYAFEQGKVKYHFSTQDGLHSNAIKTLKVVGNWVFATAGAELYRIHLPTKKVEFFTKNLGIIAQDIEGMEVRENRLYLASNKGLFSLPIDHPAFNHVAPNIQIERVLLGDSSLVLNDGIIQLSYKHSAFRIEFASTAFRARGDFYYEYRIPELDKNWMRLSAENSYVAFSAMPAGRYQFEVRAVNESGVPSTSPAQLSFEVTSPIWQRWWFFLLLSLLFVAVVLFFNTIRWRILSRRFALEQELSRSQLTALKAQMNPHFMYNALNSIQDLMLMQDMRRANRYLNKFSNLMRKILNASDHDEILLCEEIELLELYLDLEKLRFGDEFQYQIDVGQNIDPERERIASMLIQPFAENAIKHGLLHKKGNKNIHIEFKKAPNHLLCSIRDNGVGRKRAEEIKHRGNCPPSFATKATSKRLEILNAYYKEVKIGLEIIDLYNEEGQPTGTEVILRLPTQVLHS